MLSHRLVFSATHHAVSCFFQVDSISPSLLRASSVSEQLFSAPLPSLTLDQASHCSLTTCPFSIISDLKLHSTQISLWSILHHDSCSMFSLDFIKIKNFPALFQTITSRDVCVYVCTGGGVGHMSYMFFYLFLFFFIFFFHLKYFLYTCNILQVFNMSCS